MLRALLVSIILLNVCATPATVHGQSGDKAALRKIVQHIIDTSGAKVGVSMLGLDFTDSLMWNGNQRFPMQSVFKFPQALAVLDAVDRGERSLEHKISIRRTDLDTDTWSPMLKDFPPGDFQMSESELLRYSVSKSDNNACDQLFRLTGGTSGVHHYLQHAGIKGIAIRADEATMKTGWSLQYTNWSTPAAMLRLLQLFYKGKLLSRSSTAFLTKLMTESENSPNRILGMLPKGTVVAHKTGTSGTHAGGMKAATNDVGIITLPDGRHYALVVYVSDYYGGTEKGERIIAAISLAVWEYLTGR